MQHKKPKHFKAIEDFINAYVDTNGYAPTVRDISQGIGICPSAVANYLKAMETDGLIAYDEHRKPITRMMLNDLENTTRTPLLQCGAPLVGSISCGEPVDAYEYVEDTIKLPKSIFGEGPLFVLRASGESMIEAGIEDGDLVVVRQQHTANPGQIIVALIDGATTLKGYFPEPKNKRIRLQPANHRMEPMYFDHVEIQGVAIKIIKNANEM